MEDRKFIGIGKILIDTPSEEWNIPNLHFIVCESGEKTYEAVNLEFGLVSIGESGMDAAKDLTTLTWTYVLSVIKDGNGYKELREMVRKNFMFDYWAEYRGIEFDLAETSSDLSHDYNKRINIAIRESFTDELKEALKRSANQTAEKIVFLLSVRPPVVEYKEIYEKRRVA
ncbi:MAG: hypothetical protein LBG27_03315 [Spirochaetaceae bacterium]|nr:hypothetical protein [Spirochaetaceae bacterium]